MIVSEVLERASVQITTDVDYKTGELTTWFISHSDKPLTKKEAKVLERMKRAAGEKQKIVFLPEPR